MEISLKQITYFLRLVERRSFTAGAASLEITQPALSIAISQLEKALGVPLFDRSSNPLGLTEFGEAFSHSAIQVQNDLQNGRDAIAALKNGTLGRLNICIGPSAASVEISNVLSSMVTDYPGAEIQVFTGVLPGVAERISSGEFLVYLGTVPPDFGQHDLQIAPLARLPLRVVAGARHPLCDGRAVTPGELVKYPLLAIGDLDSNLPGWQLAFQNSGVQAPEPAIGVRDLTLVRAMLMQGNFVSIMPLSMARPDIDAGTLALAHPSTFDWSLELKIVTRVGAGLSAAARIFKERVSAAFSEASKNGVT